MTDRMEESWRSRAESSEVERDLKAFTGLLDLAEEVYSRREVIRRQAFVSIGSSLAAILVTGAAIASFMSNMSAGEFQNSPLFIVLASVIFAAYAGGIFLFSQARKQLRRETKAFEEVMSVVHEVLETSKAHMSPLEIAQIKIRLSRIDN